MVSRQLHHLELPGYKNYVIERGLIAFYIWQFCERSKMKIVFGRRSGTDERSRAREMTRIHKRTSLMAQMTLAATPRQSTENL